MGRHGSVSMKMGPERSVWTSGTISDASQTSNSPFSARNGPKSLNTTKLTQTSIKFCPLWGLSLGQGARSLLVATSRSSWLQISFGPMLTSSLTGRWQLMTHQIQATRPQRPRRGSIGNEHIGHPWVGTRGCPWASESGISRLPGQLWISPTNGPGFRGWLPTWTTFPRRPWRHCGGRVSGAGGTKNWCRN